MRIKVNLFASLIFFIFFSISCLNISLLAAKINEQSAYPIITGNIFYNLCHHKIISNEFNPQDVEEGDLIFLHPHQFKFFLSVMNQISNKFILITHLTPQMSYKGNHGKKILDNPNLVAWFVKNGDGSHPKIHYLPNGVGTVTNLPTSFSGQYGLLRTASSQLFFVNKDKKKFSLFKDVGGKNQERKYLLNASFTEKYNKVDRLPVRDYFSKKTFCTFFPYLKYDEYIQTMQESFFVLSPRGTSMDCYRTWEAIICGSSPVVLSSFLDKEYEDFPITIVNSWEEVSENFLLNKKKALQKQSFSFEKIFADFWIQKIANLRDQMIPNAKKDIFVSPFPRLYLDFPLLPFKEEQSSLSLEKAKEWVASSKVKNLVVFDPKAVIPLALAIPSFGHVILVADLSLEEKNQFLSNILHLFLAQRVILFTPEKWESYKNQSRISFAIFNGVDTEMNSF